MSKVDLQPVLQGDSLSARPIADDDWPGLFAAASDPEIWALHPANDRYKEPVFRQYFDDALASGSALVITDNESQQIIGSSRYNDYSADLSEIEIGWTFLARAYWGGVYNRELKRLMTNHALSFVDTVVFWVGEQNLRSRRAMEKIGGKKRDGVYSRSLSANTRHVIYEIRQPLD